MKKLFTILFALFTLGASAQKNSLLEPSFWRNSPDVAAIKAEVEKGNNPAQYTANNFDAVVYAINGGASTEAIQYLLAQPGNDVNKLTHDGRTYLFWAAMKGNTDVMEHLISKGAKTNLVDNHGATVLTFAAGGGQQNTKVYDICIANGADLKKELNHDGANALMLAVANDKDFALLNYFTGKGLSIHSTDANGNTVFNYAARTGNIELLNALIKKGVKYNDNAMLMAAQGTRGSSNGVEVFKYLESLKLKPTVTGKNGENVLHSLARRPKQLENIQYFLLKGVDVNKADNEGNTPFMFAAAGNNDIETLTLLSASVKNINQVNHKGVSALAMAVRGNSPEVVSRLLSKGADIEVTDSNGDNLAYYLVQAYNPRQAAGFEPKVQILQEKGFDFAAPQSNGNTLYHLAVAKNNSKLLTWAGQFKVDVNAKNKDSLTALHKAAMVAQDDALLKQLLAIGAKKDIATDMKETAFDLASENETLAKNKVSVEFLK
ncbi:MAG: ankyrin repeat domain-containing protein [Sphingobacteriaceae bacterium]|nr:MAG: ankyrin repeat domain-containing protein [Sphingobacteriaceae bacterium]